MNQPVSSSRPVESLPATDSPAAADQSGKPGSPREAASAARPKRSQRSESWRETIESVVIAFVLAFLFRTFEAEAFVIPTGSMAPTLFGQHRDVTCTKCGTRFACSASEEVHDGLLDPNLRTSAAVCPNCRFPNNVFKEQMFKGDRILVNKFPYEFSTPNRWDVVVFKYPEQAATNYIKRLVGLPGEELKLEWGDVYVRKLGTHMWRIPRKEPDKQKVLQLLVYDDAHPPTELLAAGWPERWAPAQPGTWTHDPATRSFQIDANPAQAEALQWLRYRNLVPSSADWSRVLEAQRVDSPTPASQLITDFYAYNAKVTAPQANFSPGKLPELATEESGVQWVGDLTVSGEVEVLAAQGTLLLELVEGERRYRCSVDLKTGKATLQYLDDRLNKPDPQNPAAEEVISLAGEADTPLNTPGTYQFTFANVDDRLCFWVDDRLVKSVDFDPGSRYPPQEPPIAPTQRDLSPVGIAARGAQVRVSGLRIERDTYYRQDSPPNEREYNWPSSPDELRRLLSNPDAWFTYYREQRYRPGRSATTYILEDSTDGGEDQFFVLGDNSPRSRDSRLWETSHTVPRHLLIGKAFYIYWPHGIPFLNDGKGYPISYYDERKWDERRGQEVRVRSDSPKFSIPFYPQLRRMKRIR